MDKNLTGIPDENFFQGTQFQRLRFGVEYAGIKRKIFYLMHGKDGSLYVEIPYYKGNKYYCGVMETPSGALKYDYNWGKSTVAYKKPPKFAYKYQSGLCHFSKTGPDDFLFKGNKLQMIPLSESNKDSHIFTIQAQNFKGFELLKEDIKERQRGIINAVYDLEDEKADAMKFIGRVTSLSEYKRGTTYQGNIDKALKTGVHYFKKEGKLLPVIPYSIRGVGKDQIILYIVCERIAPYDKDTETSNFIFLGGFEHVPVRNIVRSLFLTSSWD